MPTYDLYGKFAPLKRNLQIIEYANLVIAFWDKKSRGAKFVIDNCKKSKITVEVVYFAEQQHLLEKVAQLEAIKK